MSAGTSGPAEGESDFVTQGDAGGSLFLLHQECFAGWGYALHEIVLDQLPLFSPSCKLPTGFNKFSIGESTTLIFLTLK